MPTCVSPFGSGTESPRIFVNNSRDVAEHASGMRGWDLRVDQYSSGPFEGRIVELSLRNMQVLRERTTQSVLKQGTAWPGAVVFSLPIEASGSAHLNGHALSFPNLLLDSGSDLPALLTPRYLDVVSIAVKREWLACHLARLGETALADLVGADGERHVWINAGKPHALAMQQCYLGALDACERSAIPTDSAEACHALEDVLLQALVDALSSERHISLSTATRRKRIADRACAIALSNTDEPPTVAELCRHVGLSRRGLQDCFNDAFGMAPVQFLRAARLNAVRHELRALAAEHRRVSIGDVAAKWGFWHWSRFAGDYRSLFGELPSRTVQDSQQKAARPLS